MDDTEFWALIERARSVKGSASDQAEWLTSELAKMPLNTIKSFDRLLEAKVESVNVGDLWGAAMLLNGGQCSDDCFRYFRYWLVAKGVDNFAAVREHPDALADLLKSSGGQERDALEYEEFGFIAMRAHEKASGGKPLSTRSRQKTRIGMDATFDWREYTNEVLEGRLPNLWALFGPQKLANDRRRETEVKRALNNLERYQIPGIGVVRVGSKVHHKRLGIGTVKGLSGGLVVTAVIAFPDGDQSIVLMGDAITRIVE